MVDSSVPSSPGNAGLNLVSNKNNSHSVLNSEKCPNIVGHFVGAFFVNSHDYLIKIHSHDLRCKKWGCKHCGPINKKVLAKRIYRGSIWSEIEDVQSAGQYNVKFLTLTVPGQTWRDKIDPESAHVIASHNIDKLIRALKKYYGIFSYIKVVEPQADGYPHYHILLVGRAIAPKSIDEHIKNLWIETYGMGFTQIKNIWNSKKHVVRYIMKYITKSKESVETGGNRRMKKIRKYTTSQGALEKVARRSWVKTRVYIGRASNNPDECFEVEIDPDQPDHEQWIDRLLMDQFDIEKSKNRG